jgi:hypothetical protein
MQKNVKGLLTKIKHRLKQMLMLLHKAVVVMPLNEKALTMPRPLLMIFLKN